MLNLFINLM